MTHDWAHLVTLAVGATTETIQQCRHCAAVRHVCTYATLDRSMSTTRQWERGAETPHTKHCYDPR